LTVPVTVTRLFHPGRRKYAFTVVGVNRLVHATEVVLEPKDGMFHFEPGSSPSSRLTRPVSGKPIRSRSRPTRTIAESASR